MVRNRRGIALRTRCRSGSAAAMAATPRTASSSFSPAPPHRRLDCRVESARAPSRRVRAARRYTSPPPQPPPRNPLRTTVREGTPSLNQPRERDHRYLHRRRRRRSRGLDENRRSYRARCGDTPPRASPPAFRARAFDERRHTRACDVPRGGDHRRRRVRSRVGVRRAVRQQRGPPRATSGSSGAAGARFATTLNASRKSPARPPRTWTRSPPSPTRARARARTHRDTRESEARVPSRRRGSPAAAAHAPPRAPITPRADATTPRVPRRAETRKRAAVMTPDFGEEDQRCRASARVRLGPARAEERKRSRTRRGRISAARTAAVRGRGERSQRA